MYETHAHCGLGVAALAHRLNKRGVPAPASLRREGAVAWGKGTVWAILRNPIYAGRLVYGKARYSDVGKKRGKRRQPAAELVTVEGGAPAIVTPELWEAAQPRGSGRKFGMGRPWHRPYR